MPVPLASRLVANAAVSFLWACPSKNCEGNQQDSNWKRGGNLHSPAALSDLPKEPACEAAFSADYRSCSVRVVAAVAFYTTAQTAASDGTGGKLKWLNCIRKEIEKEVRSGLRKRTSWSGLQGVEEKPEKPEKC